MSERALSISEEV